MHAELEQARQQFLLGVEYFEAGRLLEARQCFEVSLGLAPGRASVLLNLGITLFHLGQWHKAIPLLQQVAASDPGKGNAHAFLGLTHEALGQWQAAVDSLALALESTPGNAGLWLTYGRCQLRLGSARLALQAFDRAVATNPNLVDAWTERGSLLRELHRFEDAALCFEKALSLGADPELLGYYLASVRGTMAPTAPPRQYVEALFDAYSADFQTHLVGQLRYRAHEVLVRPLIQASRRYHAVLDLGCGSGLCGALIHPFSDSTYGVDISKAMLEQARQLGVYRDLTHADLVPFLAETTRSADLVLAADVFTYLGELSAVFQSVRRILDPAGCFAFTVELLPEKQDFQLLPSLRYAHSESYIRRLAETNSFRVRDLFTDSLRHDQLQPVLGLYFYLE